MTDYQKLAACIKAGRHSSFERCEECEEFIEIVEIDSRGLAHGQIFRTKYEPIRYFKLVKP